MATPETELPLGETAITEGILSIPCITFLIKHIDIVLTLAWMTLTEVVTITEGETSSNITEILRN